MVHKIIESLRRKGFIIISHSKKGYKLLILDDLSLAGDYIRDIDTRIKYYLHYDPKCSSTQDVAKSLAELGAPEGLVVIAEEMYGGRGRFKRKWYAPRGGLWISIMLKPKHIKALQLLSIATGVAVVKAIKNLFDIPLKLKWPNDVIYRDKKLAGILIEAGMEIDVIHYIIVGIGINVNNDLPVELKATAISLKEIIGFEIPRVPILRSILKEFDEVYGLLTQGKIHNIIREWMKYSDTIGRRVKAYFMGTTLEGKAIGIAGDGALIILDDEGKRHLIRVGDVIHLR